MTYCIIGMQLHELSADCQISMCSMERMFTLIEFDLDWCYLASGVKMMSNATNNRIFDVMVYIFDNFLASRNLCPGS